MAFWVLANAAAGAAQSQNLIQGGDGEAGACTGDAQAVTTVPGWTVIQGNPHILCTASLQIDTPSKIQLGKALLATGPYGSSALLQTADVSAASAAIDTGNVTYTLDGLLGGKAVATAAFLDGSGAPLGTAARLATVDATARHGKLRLLPRSATGLVPAGTRRIAVTLRFIHGVADNLSLKISAFLPTPALAPPPAAVPLFDHVFLIMMENTDFTDVIGNTTAAPFINALAARGFSLLNYSAIYHPSDENYLAIAGGNTFVEGAVYFPHIHVTAPHIGDELVAAGKTWRAYEQGMGTPCHLTNSFDRHYQPDDAPFINFTDIQNDAKSCRAHLVDTAQLPIDLRAAIDTPNFSWIAADDYDDGEDSGNGSPKSLRTQDAWLKRTLTPVFASLAWTKQRALLILTWDESQSLAQNHIGTILVASQGLVTIGTSSQSYNHYSLGRTIEAALNIPALTANDAYAQPVNDAFVTGTGH